MYLLLGPISELRDYAKGINEAIKNLNEKIDFYFYWINPVNWIKEGYLYLEINISNGTFDYPFIAITIFLIWLIMLGANWPKKIIWWSWIIFWLLRGFVFR